MGFSTKLQGGRESDTPKCPGWLSREAKREWHRVTPILKRLKLLNALDRTDKERAWALEEAAKIVIDLRLKAGERLRKWAAKSDEPDATLRADPSDAGSAVAILKPGVIGRIRSCEAKSDWCNVQAGGYRGYLRRSQFWGTLPGEAVGP